MNAAANALEPALSEREVDAFTIDSRDIKAGDVFFALAQPDYANNGFNGDFENAAKYAAGALRAGAAACVLRKDQFDEYRTELEPFAGRLIFVDDTVAALQRLARGVYLEWGGPVVAVTGSAGKTTAKELTAHVLEYGGRKILRNVKNYNNGLGHPLTVLNLAKDKSYDAAVLEMGMSTPMNEIARLCRITPPDVAIELNVLPVHVEHLGSIENVAKAKAELVQGMKRGGTAVLNADDPRTLAMAELADGAVVTYGIDLPADISAKDIRIAGFGKTAFRLVMPGGEAGVMLRLNGRHNILNALAAAGAGHAFKMTPQKIAERLSTAGPPPQRGEILHFAAGFTVINDSYNSNPAALMAMVQTMVDGAMPEDRLVVVAGEMLELGEAAADIHFETGKQLAEAGVDVVIGVRGLAERLVDGVRSGGIQATFVEDSEKAGDLLAETVKRGDVVLIKGSRGVRTENALAKLLEKFELETSEKV